MAGNTWRDFIPNFGNLSYSSVPKIAYKAGLMVGSLSLPRFVTKQVWSWVTTKKPNFQLITKRVVCLGLYLYFPLSKRDWSRMTLTPGPNSVYFYLLYLYFQSVVLVLFPESSPSYISFPDVELSNLKKFETCCDCANRTICQDPISNIQ